MPVLSNNDISKNKKIETSIGTNLSGIADWSSQLPFINHFKSSRAWITQCEGGEVGCQGKWSTEENNLLDLDENGWVKSLPKPEESPEYTRVSTPVFGDLQNKFPSGKYLVLYDGKGKIEYRFAGTKIESESKAGKDVIQVDSNSSGILLLTITQTDPQKTGDYIRNIRVIQAEQETLFNQDEIFNPLFLEKTKAFSTLRFMDWMQTNNSEQEYWQNRPQVQNSSYAIKGVPVEIMVALANKLKVDAWFNTPHKASDEYIKNFALKVKEKLDPELKVYIEFSNEVWNWQFQQAQYAMEEAKKRWGIEGNARMNWYGMRTAQMCDIWKEVFAEEKDRVICVISTQTAWQGLEKDALDCPLWVAEGNKPCYQYGISAYGITGYFGDTLGATENQAIVKSWLSQPKGGYVMAFRQLKKGGLFSGERQGSLLEKKEEFAYHKRVASEKGLELVAYEAGQHIVGVGNVQNDEELTNFFIALNRQPEMYLMYQELLTSWKDSGGGLLMNFSDIGLPSKFGSWGTLEYLDQPTSPKYKALMDFIGDLDSSEEEGK